MENREKGMIYDWSVCHSGKYTYTKQDKSLQSYFVPHDGDTYMREYGFETIVELKEELGQIWHGEQYMEEIIKPVAVAAMKHKPQDTIDKEKRDHLDEFIYVF